MAVYAYFACALVGRAQYTHPRQAGDAIDIVFPVFSALERVPAARRVPDSFLCRPFSRDEKNKDSFFCSCVCGVRSRFVMIVGWLKVAARMIDPYGRDRTQSFQSSDAMFDLVWILNRNREVGIETVASRAPTPPEFAAPGLWNHSRSHPRDVHSVQFEVDLAPPPETTTHIV